MHFSYYIYNYLYINKLYKNNKRQIPPFLIEITEIEMDSVFTFSLFSPFIDLLFLAEGVELLLQAAEVLGVLFVRHGVVEFVGVFP